MSNQPMKLYGGPVFGFSNATDGEVYDLEGKSGAHHYERLNVVVRTAQGSWITDVNGKKYLDCLAAYSAANLGHHHPKVVNAVIKALAGNYASVISNVVYTDPLAHFLSAAAQFVPQLAPRFGNGGNKVMPKNGGVESVETRVGKEFYRTDIYRRIDFETPWPRVVSRPKVCDFPQIHLLGYFITV